MRCGLKKMIVVIISFLGIITFCGVGKENRVERLREMMVERQIKSRGIADERVLSVMRSIERHKFVPDQNLSAAYGDHPLPIGYGQTISQPYIVALMTELCELSGAEKVLEIGTGSGYQTAVLSRLAAEVYSIEIVEPLGKLAIQRLNGMGCKNVQVRIGDGYAGWADAAPFDVIILTAAPGDIPPRLFEQLKEGGLMIAPVGDYFQELVRVRKIDGKMRRETITHVRFVPMIHGGKNSD